MKLDIQFATKEDCAAISELTTTSFHLACPEDCDKNELKVYIKEHLNVNTFVAMLETKNIIVVAKSNALIVGMMVLEPFEKSLAELDFVPAMLIHKLYVSSDYHGAGVAAKLMGEMERLTRKHGHKSAWLTVFSGNKKAIRFYEKMGFKAIGTTVFCMGNENHLDNLMAIKF